MGIRIHSRLMFKYREDLVCQWFFPKSEVFDIILRSRNSRNYVCEVPPHVSNSVEKVSLL